MILSSEVTAAILAGGKSTRMGTDKALLKIGATTLIERVSAKLRSVFQRVIIVADQHEKYAFLHLLCYPDVFHECGPLGGVHSALTHSTTPHVFITPCDLPLVSEDLIESVLKLASESNVTIVSDGTNTHPLFGIWHRSLISSIEHAIRSGEYGVFRFLEEQKVSVLDLPGAKSELRNINTPEELTRVARQK